MNVVLDISSVIWDKQQFEKDASSYYQLADEVLLFMDAFEKVDARLMIRQELLDEMQTSFPFELTSDKSHFKEFRTIAYKFLSKLSNTVEYEALAQPELITIPNILYSHYSETATIECKYLIYEMHSTANGIVFCTFSAIWTNGKLHTQCSQKKKEHDTLVHPSGDLESYINSFKKKFEHNPKHDRSKGRRIEKGVVVSPFSCFDGVDYSKPQKLLETSQQEAGEKKWYNYDDENQTFVCFVAHQENLYHGFDVTSEEVPTSIKETFHK